jgi:PilZ domain
MQRGVDDEYPVGPEDPSGRATCEHAKIPLATLLPRSELDEPTVAPGRRRWERHKISLLIALYDEPKRIPIRVTASDLSGSGCYVETLSPFPIGTVGAEVWIGAEKVKTRALVRTSDPRVGMGTEFVGLNTEDQRRFQAYLHASDPFRCSIEHQNSRAKSRT